MPIRKGRIKGAGSCSHVEDISGKPDTASPDDDISRLHKENARLNFRVAQLERMLSLQPQTGLPTHFRLELELEETINDFRRRGDARGFTILIVQLGDNFSAVRKTLKSSVSEWILYETGCRIQSLMEPGDSVFHTHESEFVLILPGRKDKALQNFLRRLIARLDEPHIFSGFNIAIRAAMGAAYWPEHGEDRSDILHRADIAAGAAVEGHKSFVLFKPEQLARALEKVELQSAIIRALESAGLDRLGDQFMLYYQPKIFLSAVSDDTIEVDHIEAEALLRWRHPQKGLIGPVTFIPLAEETGLILPLGKWLIYQCARRLAAWDAEGQNVTGASINLAINLSARQFRSQEVFDTISSALASTGLSGDRLTVELTETSLFENPDETRGILENFTTLGVKISVDDFGTGYSSLSHLHRFPLNELKIDRLFIEHLTTNHHDEIIVSSLISIAKGLGLTLVAEGVDKPEALKKLWDMGCSGFQGYLIAKPLPPEEFIAFCDKVKADGMRIRIK
jgi:EAL domain-containing protein (putative c-di-GMP-specific phosphodiesterase class I)/GGDEF domain-containing protein